MRRPQVQFVQYVLNGVSVSPEEAEFVDRMGLFFEAMSGPRTMGRIYGWLLICEPPEQSLAELAATLHVSKASVSTVIRPMSEGGLVERVPSSSRQHRYRITEGGWTEVLRLQIDRLRMGVEAAEFGLKVLSPTRPDQVERLRNLRDFMAFTEQDARDGLMERWQQYRREIRNEPEEGTDDD